jgi:signal transduction histidine kinase
VGALRDESLPDPELIEVLVDDFARSTGLHASYSESGQRRPLTPEARVAVFRTAQEALTNVAKHAAARSVEVGLDWLADAVVLTVVDDGTGAGSPITGSGPGNGLQGMRERAALAGGTLSAGPADGKPSGWRVQLRLAA